MAQGTSTLHDTTILFSTTIETELEEHNDHSEVVKLSSTGYTVIGLLLSCVWFFGTLLNVSSLAVFLKNKRLRSPTNMFVMSLNACDLLMSNVAFLCMASSWNHGWLWGDLGCTMEGFAVYFLGLTSMYILSAISFDRYIVIAKPLLSPKITHTVAGIAIGLCWLGGAVWAAAPLFGWNEYVLEGGGVSCSVIWESANPVYSSYIFTIFFFCFILPLAVIAYSYYHVFMTIRSVSRNQNWDKNSRIAKKNMKVERKMAKTIAVMLLGFLGCWMPYSIFSFIVVFQGSGVVSKELATYPAIIAKSQGLINPMIYVGTNKQFRMAFYEMIPCSGLKEMLRKREEEKPESDESDDEENDATKDDKKKSSKGKKSKKGGKTAKNAVQPAPEADAVSIKGGEDTVIEELDLTINPKMDAQGTGGGSGGAGGGAAGGGEKLEVIELDDQPSSSKDAK